MFAPLGAPQGRQMHSLGREPQESGNKKLCEPWRGDRSRLQRELQPFLSHHLSPLRGFSKKYGNMTLGLTPQAKHLPPLRG